MPAYVVDASGTQQYRVQMRDHDTLEIRLKCRLRAIDGAAGGDPGFTVGIPESNVPGNHA